MDVKKEVETVIEAPVKLFERVYLDARQGIENIAEHIASTTESEFHKTRQYLESEVASLRADIAELKAKLAHFLAE